MGTSLGRAARWALLVVTACIVGCGQDSSTEMPVAEPDPGEPDPGEPDPAESDPAALSAWNDRVTRTACEREVRCGRVSSVERCIEWRPGDFAHIAMRGYHDAATIRYFGGQDLFADLDSEYVLAEEATLSACLSEIDAGACNPLTFYPESCARALVPRAPRAQGEACASPSPYLSSRPCRDGLACVCGACAPAPTPGAEGQPCDLTTDCERGLVCSTAVTAAPTCTRGPLLGEPCDGTCAEGTCVLGACVPFAGVGEACRENSLQCQGDLDCDGVCVASAQLSGAPCTRESNQCLLWCIFDAADATVGTCGLPHNDGPTPCSVATVSNVCPASTYQSESGTGETGECWCLPRLSPGSACAPDPGSGRDPCDGYCSGGMCTPRQANGAACVGANECASFRCDTTSGTCQEVDCTP